MRVLKIGVVMDPVDKINIDKDTTFVLMLEAQRRGHEVTGIRNGLVRRSSSIATDSR